MEGEVGAQVAPPIFVHQALPGRFHEAPPLAKKRDWPWQSPTFQHSQQQQQQQPPPPQSRQGPMVSGLSSPAGNWNLKTWEWDSLRFTAKPLPDASDAAEMEQRRNKREEASKGPIFSKDLDEDGENLTLKLGGGAFAAEEAQPVVRPSKRVRSGSPGNGGGSYPMCQVDDCRADLKNAKDYHRRHKVCEVHSKTTKALVGNQMQRFCQQCSRFHLLSEFDEGKRSCRRRLAGHNRRRRKTQTEDASSRLAPGSQASSGNGNVDIVSLLSILARLQGNNSDKHPNGPSLTGSERVAQIISKINSSTTANSSSSLPEPGGIDLNVSQAQEQISSEQSTKANGSPSAPSTVDLLAVVSAALAASAPDAIAALSRVSSNSSGGEKTKVACAEPVADSNSHVKPTQILPLVEATRNNYSCHSQLEAPRLTVQEARSNLPLQLFGSAEGDSPPKFDSSRKYLSSESSNPMDDRSPPPSPPIARNLFPLHSAAESMKHERMSICTIDNGAADASTSLGWSAPLDLFKESDRRAQNGAVQKAHYQAGYTSSSGSDHSPSSSNSDAQERTGRIIFKLFDKDPSNLPGTLRTQVLHWLYNSPSEIESYIRPGCVVLSIYVVMPSVAWDELEENLVQRVSSLLQCSESEFWQNGRFLVRTNRQLASHKDGKIRLCKSWQTWSAPELTSVSPVAVVSGQKTSLLLKGRNLTVPGTKIHCTHMGGYASKEVLCSVYPGTIYDDSSLETFNFPGGSPSVFGRCFIEVENGFKGNSFPVIIADASICQELRDLESEFEDNKGTEDSNSECQIQCSGRPSSREDGLHFLNELGWLFQRKNSPSSLLFSDFSSSRFKFLFAFSVDRDWPALVKTLLDMFVERSTGSSDLLQESLEVLLEIQLLNRAVKRKCRKMVELLLHYSVKASPNDSMVYLFPANSAGPGGLTPLHLAASTQGSEDIIDALTNDPQEIGLKSWKTLRDDNGYSPYMYALMRNNHSYNRLVARKLADRKNGQVSITVGNDISLDKSWIEQGKTSSQTLQAKSCAQCALMEARLLKQRLRTRGLLQRPYIHSMLAIAAVCVCVCILFRGSPCIGSVEPFKWENLHYGPK